MKENINMYAETNCPTAAQSHIEGLDGLRGIAVIGVILYHLFPSVFKGGFLGVSLFFVLSGYLIAVTSKHDWSINQFSVGKFYKKRIKRIYPPLIIVVFVTVGLLKILSPDVLNGIRAEIASIFLGYNNLWQISQNSSYFTKIANASPFTHLWSLSIELQFYLVWPLIFLLFQFLKKSQFKDYSSYLFVIPAMLSILMLQLMFAPNQDVTNVYYGTVTRVFSIFMGAFVGIQQRNKKACRLSCYRKKKMLRKFAFLMFLLFLSYLLVDGQARITYRIGLLITSVLFCEILKLAVNSRLPIGKLLDCKPLSRVGKQSYEIYLCQYPVIFIFQYLKWDRIFIAPLVMCIIILAFSMWLHRILNIISKKLRFGGKEMKGTKKSTFWVITTFFMAIFILGGCSIISTSDTKEVSQKQLQEELNKNSQELNNQNSKDKDSDKSESSASLTAVGDSVMLGAVPSIKKIMPNCIIDAKESRQVSQAGQVIENLDNQGNLGDTVIIALGTNGSFSTSSGQALIEQVGNDRTVYWITAYGKHLQWQEEVNRTIYELAEKNSSLSVIDWAETAASHPEWFYDDGIHLNTKGQKAYADLILKSVLQNEDKYGKKK